MEIPQHFVTPPTSNGTYDISIHAGTEECHGACHSKGPRRDIFACESQIGSREEFDRGLEVGRDHNGDHIRPTDPRRLKTGERGVSVPPDNAMPPLGKIGGLLWPHGLFSHPACRFYVWWQQVHYLWQWRCRTPCGPH